MKETGWIFIQNSCCNGMMLEHKYENIEKMTINSCWTQVVVLGAGNTAMGSTLESARIVAGLIT